MQLNSEAFPFDSPNSHFPRSIKQNAVFLNDNLYYVRLFQISLVQISRFSMMSGKVTGNTFSYPVIFWETHI